MWNHYLEFLRTEIRPFLVCAERKPLWQQWRECRELWARYRCIPYHYLKHRLYQRAARPDYLDYLPAKLVQNFRAHHNPRSHARMLDDKLQTVQALAHAGVRCVETLFSIDGSGTLLRDGVAIEADAAAAILRGRGGELFLKPIDSRAGLGARVIDAADIRPALLRSMRNRLIQPVLRNHATIASLHGGSLNTVRLISLIENGRYKSIAACLRVGRGGAMVDNVSQGGIAIGIDLASGALQATGITKARYERRLYTAHPDTDMKFASLALPWWRETLQLAERAALGLQPHVMLGLDIAITPDGPVFIEANRAADIFLMQEACGPLGTTALGRSVLAHWMRRGRPGHRLGRWQTAGDLARPAGLNRENY